MMDDPILESLEQTAEVLGDITAVVYERYYRACPEAEALMAHVDQHMQGRMLDEVIRLLMTEDVCDEDGYLDFEVDNHRGYNVEPSMYPGLLRAVEDVVREGVGENWARPIEDAWQARIAALLDAIEARI